MVYGGTRTLSVRALELVREGVTTLEEVDRVLGQALSLEQTGARTDESTDEKPSEVAADTGSPDEPRVLMADDDSIVRNIGAALLRRADSEFRKPAMAKLR